MTKAARRIVKCSWAAKRFRMVVFLEKSRLWAPGRKDHGKLREAWLAADVTSYHVGQGNTPQHAVNSLLHVICGTDLLAWEEEQNGGKVIRWRCLCPKKEIREMEAKARKTGFILDGVEKPNFLKFFRVRQPQEKRVTE